MPSKRSTPFIRPLLQSVHPYVPGEQPKIDGVIKLNTNENPYPPAPQVLAATKKAVDGRLRLYPNATAQALREKLARLHQCRSENIIVGNGSDELLAMAVRAFVEPANGKTRRSRSVVQFFTPSYSLYPVVAQIHGAHQNAVPLLDDFRFPPLERKGARACDPEAALTLITTPNAPSGRAYSRADLERLCRTQKRVVVLDEAYVDFARENALALALKYPHVLVARTFSKAYSLCFQRVGYFVGHPELIAALDKIRDSYNVNGLGQIAALATLDSLPFYRTNFKKIIETRGQLSRALCQFGFQVFPSETNFLLVRPPRFSAQDWLQKLRQHKILVRWFNHPEVRDYLRVSIGTAEQSKALIRAVGRILDS